MRADLSRKYLNISDVINHNLAVGTISIDDLRITVKKFRQKLQELNFRLHTFIHHSEHVREILPLIEDVSTKSYPQAKYAC